jgi:DUF4097 and DUF4098 domain-containing protein YvlB
MEKALLKKLSLVSLLCLMITLAGCCINIGSCAMRAKYQRTVQLSAPLSPGTARAKTEEDAKKLAEKTTVRLESFGEKLIVKIDKPTFLTNKSVNVSLDVQIPNESDLGLTTHNGSVEIRNITGRLNGTTHNGKITAEQVSGTTELHTHNGSVTCREISGDCRLKSHKGSVKVYYSKAAPSVCDISLITHNGGIELETPSDFSGEVDVSTSNGSVRTDLPITIVGKVSKRRLSGKIGTGRGKLHLETHNGSIRIK